MKANHLISLLQSGYTTAKVSFTGKESSTLYTYKVPLDAGIQAGDYVVVATDDLRLSVALVVEVDDFPDIDTSANIVYKWIVQRVDLESYKHQLDVENRFRKHLQKLERHNAKSASLQAFAAQFAAESEERQQLDALISGTTTIEALVEKLDAPKTDAEKGDVPNV